MGQQFNTELEQVKRSCTDLVSQMQCPHHFQTATVEMDDESIDAISMDVITCCDEFRKRVEEAVDKLVAQQSLIVTPSVPITPPNPSIKYSRANLPPGTATTSILRIR